MFIQKMLKIFMLKKCLKCLFLFHNKYESMKTPNISEVQRFAN